MRCSAAMLLAACGGASVMPASPPEATYELLAPTEQLVRASMAIRGVRPSVEELERIEADPEALEQIVDEYVRSPEFAETVRDLHAELFLVRADVEEVMPNLGPLGDTSAAEIFAATSEEPLRLVEHVVTNDRPYSEILTADYAMANAVLAKIYRMEPLDPSGPEWQPTHYTDGRQHAGVLSSSEIYRRYPSNGSNFERGRASFFASTFLCDSFTDRDVVIESGTDLTDDAAVAEAVTTQESCISCHQTLDPLAGLLWGFPRRMEAGLIDLGYSRGCRTPIENEIDDPEGYWRFQEDFCYPLRFYLPENEQLWTEFGLREPSYYGQPASSLVDLGQRMAEDPRFARCSAKQLYRWFTQTELEDISAEQAARLQADFEADGLEVRRFVKRLALSDAFRALAEVPATSPLADPPPVQVVRPEQYARTVEALTGFVWRVDPTEPNCKPFNCWREVDLGRSDRHGFRALSGGVDGISVVRPIHAMTPTKVMVMGRFAAEAAGHAVTELLRPREERTLLRLVDADTTDEGAVRAQIADLTLRILSRRVDPEDPEVTELYLLFALGSDGPTGWKLVLTALLQDPAVLYY